MVSRDNAETIVTTPKNYNPNQDSTMKEHMA